MPVKPKSCPQGCPQKRQRMKKKGLNEQAQAPCPRPSRSWPSSDANTDDDTGTPESWDPHAGLKPSPQDDCASDADIKMEEDLPYGAVNEVSDVMIDMMVDLDDCDTRDLEWLPLKEQRKLATRKTGLISCASRL